MPPATISICLATEDDAPSLASVMTTAFASSDKAYPLIWGSAKEGTHDMVTEKALFSPVQKEGRVTYKAVDTQSGRMVGFATWNMPKAKVAMSETVGKEERKGWLPELPGVNMELWNEKAAGPKKFYERDVDPSKDIRTSPFISIFHLTFLSTWT
jgi:hypothetical protein